MSPAALWSPLAVLVLSACHGSSSDPSPVLAAPVATNSSLAVKYWTGTGELWILMVREAEQGALDLNDDGDSADDVVCIADLATGAVTNTGLATVPYPFARHDVAPPNLAANGSLAVFGVSESFHGGLDLNGDGDALDSVLHVYDRSSASVTNTGLAIGSYLLPGERLVPLMVTEQGQGGLDLNGDGDAFDNVLHFYDARSRASENLQRTDTLVLGAVGDLVVLLADEGEALVFQLYDVGTGETLDADLAAYTAAVARRVWGVFLQEVYHGDLDGDGDAEDRVFHAWDPDTGAVRNTHLAGSFYPEPYRPFVSSSERFVLAGEEHAGALDLNGDGDQDDPSCTSTTRSRTR